MYKKGQLQLTNPLSAEKLWRVNFRHFQSGNKLFSIVDYPHLDGSKEHPHFSIESQDDGNQLCFELESIEQLQAIIQHLTALESRWPTDK